jgi:hypothetical protein
MFKRLSLIILGFVFFKTTAQSSYQVIPSQNAKPWVFWYWMQGGVSKAGITADLEAMKEVGIGGAYLMPIKGPANPPVYTPAIQQLTPEWWEMVRFSMSEAKRLGLQMGMHVSDGFALAGGPWIRPEQSMQKVVSASVHVSGGKRFNKNCLYLLSKKTIMKILLCWRIHVCRKIHFLLCL